MEAKANPVDKKEQKDEFLLYIVSLTGDVHHMKSDKLPKECKSTVKDLKEAYVQYLKENEVEKGDEEKVKILMCYHGKILEGGDENQSLEYFGIEDKDVIHWIPE